MTNRFFRNAVGVAALTSLALGLACSGSSDPDPVAPPATVNKPGTPIVSISGLPGSNNAITKHQYLISASDPSGLATSFTATGNNGGTLTAISGANGMWTYIPQKEGNEIITVKGTNSAGTSDGGGVMASVVKNQQPSIADEINAAPGATRNVSLPSVDGDGDSVTWTLTDKGGLDATINGVNGPLTIKIGADAKTDSTYTIKLTSTETHPTAKYIVDNTQVHSLVVKITATGGGDDLLDWSQGDTRGQIHAFPNNSDEVAFGVPFTFQFNAGDPFVPTNRITKWLVNGGLSPYNEEGENAPPPKSWIGQPQVNLQYMRPAIGALGDAFERWRLGTDYQKNGASNNRLENFPGGRLYFVAQNNDEYTYYPDTYSSRTLFGVRANFANDGVFAYQDFYIKVTDNQPPVLPWLTEGHNTDYNSKLTITVLNKRTGQAEFGGVTDPRADANVPAEVPWAGKFSGSTAVAGVGITYANESRLVFRHENDDYSYDMAASMSLGALKFTDPDIKKFGDVLTFMLDGVTYGDNRERRFGGLGADRHDSTTPGLDSTDPAYDPPVAYNTYARDWTTSNGSNQLKGSKWDVTSVIRPLLARPYPVLGKDRDAIRTYADPIYFDGKNVNDSEDGYEDGRRTSIYVAHAGSDNAVYINDTDYNARGNLLGLTTNGETVYPSPLQFVRVPKLSDFITPGASNLRPNGINGSEGLTFHYTAIDLGGKKQVFQVYVPTRANWAPQLDAYEWTDVMESGIDYEDEEENPLTPTDGDVRGERFLPDSKPSVWATSQPAEGEKNSWGFVWSTGTAGVDPAQYYIADQPYTGISSSTSYGNGVYSALANQASADPVYLMIPPGESTDGSKNVNNFGGLNNPVKPGSGATTMHGATSPFIFDWTPTINQGRKYYDYTIYGWDKYGAGMRPFPMHGRVFGSLEGTPIYKLLYNNGAVLPAGPADLTINGNARVSINPFFNNDFPPENRLANQYGLDADQPWLSINQKGLNNPWHVSHVPPNTPMLVSAARSSAGDEAVIIAPVIGPAVVSADGTRVGRQFASIDTAGGTAALTSDKAAEYDTTLWETGNLISYAYIDPMQAEESVAMTDPSKRLKVDLTTHVGSGQLALLMDKSLNLPGADGDTIFNDTELTEPEKWGWASAAAAQFDYYGLMYGVGASGITAKGVIQVVMPSVGQSAFFHIEDPGTAPAFPSAAYPNRLGWFNPYLTAKTYKYSNLDQNFEPVVLPVFPNDGGLGGSTDLNYNDYIDFVYNGSAPAYASGLPYKFHIGEDGTPNYTLVSLIREDKDWTWTPAGGSGTSRSGYPVWTMQKTGVPTELKSKSLLNFDNEVLDSAGILDHYLNKLQHESRWLDPTEETFGTFNATVNRGAFAAYLNRLVSRSTASAVVRADVVDTLQVVSYVSGTDLGPVDNHQGLPVYIEFGDLNHYNGSAAAGNGHKQFDGTYALGSYPINKPDLWQTEVGGDKNYGAPVASYIARYKDPATNLAGTMGLITDQLSAGINLTHASIAGFAPVSQVRITGYPAGTTEPASGPAEHGTASAHKAHNRDTAVSVPIASYISTGTTVVEAAAAPVVVKAFNDDGRENYKVWLTWVNPAKATTAGLSNHDKPNISGNIIEFFNAANFSTDSMLNDTAVPIYKVYVGPSISQFPIPDSWLPYLGFEDAGFNKPTGSPTAANGVVVRIRTVRYGDKAKGNFVNFDESPFKQALPAVWMDTLTTKLNFHDVGSDVVALEAESPYNGFKKTGQEIDGITSPISPALAFSSTPPTALATITLSGVSFPGVNDGGLLMGDSTDIVWDAEFMGADGTVTGSTSAGGGTITKGDFSLLNAANGVVADSFTGTLAVTVDSAAWAAAQPGTPGEDDAATAYFDIRLTATYNKGANPRSASTVVRVPFTASYGVWGGFIDGDVLTVDTPATASFAFPETADSTGAVTDIAGFTNEPLAVTIDSLASLNSSRLTYAWVIDAAGATVTSTLAGAPTAGTAVGGVTLGATTTMTPTISINPAFSTTGLHDLFSGATWAAGTITVTVPLKVTVTYTGNDTAPLTARDATATVNVTYTITIN